MTTTLRPDHLDGPALPAVALLHRSPTRLAVLGLRLGIGWIFLWPFLDKTFGLGYSTPGARAWLNGGSPTKGFLGHVEVGPFQSMFRGMAGNVVVDWLFMLTLLGVGVAVLAGVVLRIAAISGSILMVAMWAAEWPLAQHSSLGEATASTNPFVDYHLVFALGLWVIAAAGAASAAGLGAWWSSRPLVIAHPVLR